MTPPSTDATLLVALTSTTASVLVGVAGFQRLGLAERGVLSTLDVLCQPSAPRRGSLRRTSDFAQWRHERAESRLRTSRARAPSVHDFHSAAARALTDGAHSPTRRRHARWARCVLGVAPSLQTRSLCDKRDHHRVHGGVRGRIDKLECEFKRCHVAMEC